MTLYVFMHIVMHVYVWAMGVCKAMRETDREGGREHEPDKKNEAERQKYM